MSQDQGYKPPYMGVDTDPVSPPPKPRISPHVQKLGLIIVACTLIIAIAEAAQWERRELQDWFKSLWDGMGSSDGQALKTEEQVGALCTTSFVGGLISGLMLSGIAAAVWFLPPKYRAWKQEQSYNELEAKEKMSYNRTQ